MEPVPASTRQPKHEPFVEVEEDSFVGLMDEALPPESGEVASQQLSTIGASGLGDADASLFPWEQDSAAPLEVRLLAEPSSLLADDPSDAAKSPLAEVAPEVTRRVPLRGEAAQFLLAASARAPSTFGELLELSLSLGE
jgi:hypothetical protein